LVTPAIQRRLRRKSQRGMTVLTVVMAVTLLLSIGILAVRSAAMADQAVGFSRLSSQTAAAAELGTSAVIADFGANRAADYLRAMDGPPDKSQPKEKCLANTVSHEFAPCKQVWRSDIERSTQTYSGKDLFQKPAAGESGSFGISNSMMGSVYVEITEKSTAGPVAGANVGEGTPSLGYAKVVLTTTAQVRPVSPTGVGVDQCDDSVALVTSKKVMRARVVVGPI
jgi:Tfp pilus assembly protein PilV